MGIFPVRLAAGLLVVLLVHSAISGCSKTDEDIAGEIVSGQTGAAMDIFLTRLHNFGYHGSVLVARHDSILLHKAYGIASVRDSIPNHTTTLFSTGSVTKQFTAAAIIYLESKGRLRVSDSISRFFADVPEDKKDITIHHLLTHTSGLAPEFGPDEEELSRDEFLKRALSIPLAYPIGDHYEYSNAGYSMLAAIIEIVTGVEYETFLVDNLFHRIGMKSTGLKSIAVPDSMIARSHDAEMNYPSPADRPDHYYNLKGNGGMLSTPADMYRWYRALRSGTLFPREVSKKLFIPAVREYEDGNSYYGYGWVIQEYNSGDTLIWHNGGALPHGWSCAVYHFVQDDLFCVVFSNAPIDGSLPVDDIIDKLSLIALGDEYTLPPEVSKLAPGAIGPIGGTYSLDNGRLSVAVEGDRISVAPDGQDAFDLIFPSPFAPRLFKYNNLTAELVGHIAAGRFAKAAEYYGGMDDPLAWRLMIREWWESFAGLGRYRGIHVYGTMVGGAARTYCRLDFETKSVICRFGWMGGKCGGMMTTEDPAARVLLPQSATRFAGYSLSSADILIAGFRDDELILSVGNDQITAVRK